MTFVSWLILGPIVASGSTIQSLLAQDGFGQHPHRRDEEIGIIQRKNEIVEQAWINANSVASRNFLLPSPPATTSSTTAAGSSSIIGSISSSMVRHTPTMIHQKNDHKEDEENPSVNLTTSQLQRKLPPASCLDTPALCPQCHFDENCCMLDNAKIYGGINNLQCTTNSLKIQDVNIIKVSDPAGAYKCNCNGVDGLPHCNEAMLPLDCQGKKIDTYFGVCTDGAGDTVTVTFAANIQISNAEYDVALYINTEGGNASTGSSGCVIEGLQQTVPIPSPLIGNAPGSSPTDECLDLLGAGNLVDYPFPELTLSCTDSDNDEYLDFSVGVSFSNNIGERRSSSGFMSCLLLMTDKSSQHLVAAIP